MVSSGRGARLFRRKDGKYLIYVPKDLAEDSMFPFTEEDFSLGKRGGSDSIIVKVRALNLLIEYEEKLSKILTPSPS